MAIPRKPCWHSFSLLTPAGHSSSTLAHPLVSIKILSFPSKTQTAASESPYQHNIPLNSGRLIWIYFLAAVCLNYISAQLAMMSIATKIPQKCCRLVPHVKENVFCTCAACIRMSYKKIQFDSGKGFLLVFCLCAMPSNCLIPYMCVWQEAVVLSEDPDSSRQSVYAKCRPASSTWQCLWVCKNCSEGKGWQRNPWSRAGKVVSMQSCRAKRRWCGDRGSGELGREGECSYVK